MSGSYDVVVRQEGVLGGRPTFRGTRVQAEILFENLAEGYSIDEIVDNFPTLDRDDLKQAILEAGRLVMQAAPKVDASVTDDTNARLSRWEHAPATSADPGGTRSILGRE